MNLWKKSGNLIFSAPMEKAPQPLSKLLVLDFEATCDSEKFSPPEIIEFPVVVFDTATLRIEEEFHQYVRPTVNPQLTPFCTQLTGIQQVHSTPF